MRRIVPESKNEIQPRNGVTKSARLSFFRNMNSPRWSLMERLTLGLASASSRWASPPLPAREREVECHHWTAIENGSHNLTTDLTYWNGHFWLVHSLAPWHIASSRSRLVLWRSVDAVHWEPM